MKPHRPLKGKPSSSLELIQDGELSWPVDLQCFTHHQQVQMTWLTYLVSRVECHVSASELQLVILQKQSWLITWSTATKKDSTVSWSRSSWRPMLDWNSSSLGGFIAEQFIRQNWWLKTSQQTGNTVTSDCKPNKATRFFFVIFDEVQIHSARKLQLPAHCFYNSRKTYRYKLQHWLALDDIQSKTRGIQPRLLCLPWRKKAAHHFLRVKSMFHFKESVGDVELKALLQLFHVRHVYSVLCFTLQNVHRWHT